MTSCYIWGCPWSPLGTETQEAGPRQETGYPHAEKAKCPSCKSTTSSSDQPPPPAQPARKPWETLLGCTEPPSLGSLIISRRLTESGLETSIEQWLLDLPMFLRMHYFKIILHPSKGCGVKLDNTWNQETEQAVSTVPGPWHRYACFSCPVTPCFPSMFIQVPLGFPSWLFFGTSFFPPSGEWPLIPPNSQISSILVPLQGSHLPSVVYS